MPYKIGDIAKILGISPDLMRYYEKKGIVKPTKDKFTDYRYYDSWDVNFLIECLWFKKFGFGMKEISQIVSQYSYDTLQETLDKKCGEIQEEIEREKSLLECLERHKRVLEDSKSRLGQCDIQDSPEIVLYLNRYNFTYDESPDVQKMDQQWVAYLPYIRRCFDISQEDLNSGGTNYAWGFYMDMDYARRYRVKIEPPAFHLPSRRSVHSVFRKEGKNNFSPKLLGYMVEYARQQGLRICGGAHGSLLCSVRENGEMTGYFEAWIPVENADLMP